MRHFWFGSVAAAIGIAIGVAGCGDLFGDDAPANTNSSTCYRCTLSPSGGQITQTTYSCSAADAQQFGRPCLR